MRNPKSEIQDPKEARKPKTESGAWTKEQYSDFEIRISFGFRQSDFGFYFV